MIKYIAGISLYGLFLFGFFVFVSLQPNILLWSVATRFIFVALYVLGSLGVFAIAKDEQWL